MTHEVLPPDPTNEERFSDVTTERLSSLWLLRAASVELAPAYEPYRDQLLSLVERSGKMPDVNPVKALVHALAFEALTTEDELQGVMNESDRRTVVDSQIADSLQGLLYVYAAGAVEAYPARTI